MGGRREGGREGGEAIVAAQVGVEREEAGRPHQKDSREGYVADDGVKGGRERKREGNEKRTWCLTTSYLCIVTGIEEIGE